MKKLLCLVFVLIALLGLTFAVSAAEMPEAVNVASNDISTIYMANGSQRGDGKGCNGGHYSDRFYDGNLTNYTYFGGNDVGDRNGNDQSTGAYIILDLNAKLAGGYYVNDIVITDAGYVTYSLYYTNDGVTWNMLTENHTEAGSVRYTVAEKATQVKFVFNKVYQWTQSLAEIQVFGIDPADMPCLHPNIGSQPWVYIAGTGSCTENTKECQVCPDCGENGPSRDGAPLGHDLSTNVTKPGTNISYGEGTIVCSRCDYAIDFHGEVNLANDYYYSVNGSTKFVNVYVSSMADKWGSSKAVNMFNNTWSCSAYNSWFSNFDVANYNDNNEYAIFEFKGDLDLTKIDIMVPNDSAARLLIWAMNENGEYEIVKDLPTYDESLGEMQNSDGIRMTIPMLGITTNSLKIQVISPSYWYDGFQYNAMIIGECHVYAIAPGCGLDATNHECVYDTFVKYDVAPTCQTAGKAIYKCACNSTTTVDVEASEEYHPYVEVEGTRVNSTCTVAGSYTGKCELCNAETTITLDFDTENGHEFEETSREDADCVNAGKIVYTCANCKATKEEEIKATGHNYQETSKTEADCKNAGEIISECANCGDEKKEEIPVKDHTWVLDEDGIEEEPTCGTVGKGAYYCSVCSATERRDIPATGEHTWNEDYDELILAPSCEGTGAAQFSCVDCSATERRVINALGHDLTVEVEGSREEATCTTAGSYQVTCANGCGLTNTKPIAALDHDLTEATCKEPATCKREGCTYKGTELAAHTWGNVACTAGNCVVCGAENPDADKVAHTYGWNIGTKIVDGKEVQMHGCSVCLTEAVEATDAAGNGLGYSDNLGIKIKYVSSGNELYDLLYQKTSVDAKVYRLTGNTSLNKVLYVYADVIIDLGGFAVETTHDSAVFHLGKGGQVDSLVNGTINKTKGGRYAVLVYKVNYIKDIKINITSQSFVTGIILWDNGYIKEIRNVEIYGAYNHGIEAHNSNNKIDLIEGCRIEALGQGITSTAVIGKIKDTTIKGDNVGFAIEKLKGTMEIINCTIEGGDLALRISDAEEGSKFIVGSDTTFKTGQILFDINSSIKNNDKYDLTLLNSTVAAVNGKLYDKIADAVVALKAAPSDKVTEFALMNNLEINEAIVIDKKVNFSLGGGSYKIPVFNSDEFNTIVIDGYTISAAKASDGNGVFHVVAGGDLTISGSGIVNAKSSASGDNDFHMAVWVEGGKAVINGGTYTNENCGDDDQYDLIYVKGGELIINDGKFISATPKWTLNINDSVGGTILVNGGLFYQYNPAEAYTETTKPISFVSETIKCVIEINGYNSLAEKHYFEHSFNELDNPKCIETHYGPTCTENGYKIHACACGEYVVETLTDWENKPLGHNYVPVENEDGSTTYTCQNGCNDSYVINNAAVNGTYCMLGMPANSVLVFANGALTVDGEEGFTYTYNVTTGMIETTLGTFFQVIDGKIYHRGSQELKAHSYVADVTAPTCTDKGYTTYTCPACNDTYKDNETAALGHTEAIDQAVAPTCTETGLTEGKHCSVCNVTLVAQDTVDALGHTEVIDQAVAPTCTATGLTEGKHCSVCNVTLVAQDTVDALGHTEAIDQAVAPTCTTTGLTEGKHCSVCNEVLVAQDTVDALGHTPGKAVVENEVPATPTTSGSYDEVVYCVTCKVELSRKSVTVEPTCKHTNKEIIPAVLPLPSNNSTAYTEGVKCLDCGETITAQEKISVTNTPSWSIFGIGAVELILNNNISLNYKINVNSGYTIEYLAFVFEDVEYTLDEYMSIDAKGRYIFKFDKTRPHKINSTISAYVYGKTENGYVVDKYDYSVMEYCLAIINENNPAKTTVISDLLYMGAATQKYIASNNNTQLSEDELVTTIAAKLLEEQGKGYKLTPSTFTGKVGGSIPTFKDYDTSNAMWLTANVLIGSSTSFEYCFKAKNIEGLTVVVEVDGVKKLELTSDDLTIDAKGRYVAKVECITSIQYGSEVKATIMDGDVALGSISYSINEYLAYTCGESTGSKLELAKAVYNFGKSAYDLFN